MGPPPQHITLISLFDAIAEKNGDDVRYLVSQGVDINGQEHDGNTPLMTAVEDGAVDIVQSLLSLEAVTDLADNNGHTAFHKAILANQVECLKLLREARCNISIAYGETMLPLGLAVMQRKPEIISLLLSWGASPFDRPQAGRSALFWASYEGLEAELSLLLSSVADGLSNEHHREYKLCEIAALINNHRGIFDQLLVKFGTDIQQINYSPPTTAIFWNRLKGDSEQTRYLYNYLKFERSIDDITTQNISPLLIAAAYGHQALVLDLIERGSDLNYCQDSLGDTALMWATIAGHKNTVDTLLAKGADPQVKNKMGLSAVDLVESYGYFLSHRLIMKSLRSPRHKQAL